MMPPTHAICLSASWFPFAMVGQSRFKDAQKQGLKCLVGTVTHPQPDHLRRWALLEEKMQEVANLRHDNGSC